MFLFLSKKSKTKCKKKELFMTWIYLFIKESKESIQVK